MKSRTHHCLYAVVSKMAEEPQNLRAVYNTAESKRKELDVSYDTNSPAYQEKVNAALKGYEQCLKIAGQISLFSPNESLDDISSNDIQ